MLLKELPKSMAAAVRLLKVDAKAVFDLYGYKRYYGWGLQTSLYEPNPSLTYRNPYTEEFIHLTVSSTSPTPNTDSRIRVSKVLVYTEISVTSPSMIYRYDSSADELQAFDTSSIYPTEKATLVTDVDISNRLGIQRYDKHRFNKVYPVWIALCTSPDTYFVTPPLEGS